MTRGAIMRTSGLIRASYAPPSTQPSIHGCYTNGIRLSNCLDRQTGRQKAMFPCRHKNAQVYRDEKNFKTERHDVIEAGFGCGLFRQAGRTYYVQQTSHGWKVVDSTPGASDDLDMRPMPEGETTYPAPTYCFECGGICNGH